MRVKKFIPTQSKGRDLTIADWTEDKAHDRYYTTEPVCQTVFEAIVVRHPKAEDVRLGLTLNAIVNDQQPIAIADEHTYAANLGEATKVVNTWLQTRHDLTG